MLIPDPQWHMLLAHLVQAVADASRGHLVQGYDCLLAGLAFARELQAEGRPWASHLVRRYEQMIAAFEQRYGPRWP
jgi:hypothetical protein